MAKKTQQKKIVKKVEQTELNKDTIQLEESDSDKEEEAFDGFSSTDDESSDEEEEKKEEEKVKEHKEESNKTKHTVKKPVAKRTIKDEDLIKKIEKYKRGILYIGRLPSEVEESDLVKYFEQFGEILNCKVCRNKKTGNSKHYGFLEFSQFNDAKVAQETMNNYLIFNHQLKCELVDNETFDKEKYLGLFGTTSKSRKFKKIPWGKISKRNNDKPKTNKKWESLKNKRDLKNQKRSEKLKDAGFNFELVN